MKRLLLFGVAVIFVLCGLCGCNRNKLMYTDQLSEIRDNVYIGESEHFEVCVYTGEREQPYRLDGVAEPMVDYFLITVTPKFAVTEEDSVCCTVKIEGKKYEKRLEKHPFRACFVADLCDLNTDQDALSINVTAQHYDEDVTVSSVLKKDCVTLSEAMEKGFTHLKDSIERTKDGKDYRCEIQVKLTYQHKFNEERLYWHILVADCDGGIYAVLIDCEGEIEDASPSPEA